HRARCPTERLHRDGDATKGAHLWEPGSLGGGRGHERCPAQNGRGRAEAGNRSGIGSDGGGVVPVSPAVRRSVRARVPGSAPELPPANRAKALPPLIFHT